MIILNNQHDKNSRDFVSKYGIGQIVYNYPECIDHYSCISSFPSVVVLVPAYYQELETEEIMNEETNEIEEIIINEPGNRQETYEIIGFYEEIHENIDNFYNEVITYINVVNQRGIDSPIK